MHIPMVVSMIKMNGIRPLMMCPVVIPKLGSTDPLKKKIPPAYGGVM